LASPADGADLFMRKGCASCHKGPQTTARIGVAPSLEDVPEWAGQREPGLSASDYVRESILNPPAFISPAFVESGPTAMPSLNLTEAEVDALVAYLLASDAAP
jgi:mono/diheme cytochrome c family protein